MKISIHAELFQRQNAACCMQMYRSFKHQHYDRKMIQYDHKESRQFVPRASTQRTHIFSLLLKHVLIMSPCLYLCKHILTSYSTLCDWDLADSQHWEMGGTNATKGNKTDSVLMAKSNKDGRDTKLY